MPTTRSTLFVATAILGAAFAGALVGATSASAQTYRSAAAQSGKPLRLAVVTPFKKDCSLGELGGVKVVAAPKHGTLSLKRGKLKTPASFRCPNVEAVMEGVFYQSSDKYTGADEVTYETKAADGTITKFTVQITVSAGTPAAAGKKDDLQDL